ncbi:MAG TPA: AAA-associated domain-containing protein [Bacillota bacterium]
MELILLPDVSLSEVMGFCELLEDAGGQEDVYRISESLNLELDDILPVIEAGELLGLIQAGRGDVVLTGLGRSFLHADVNRRKTMLAGQLAPLGVFRTVLATLRQRRHNHAPKRLFFDLFAEHLPDEEAERLLKTVIDWGRYAELIGFSPETEEIYLDKG